MLTEAQQALAVDAIQAQLLPEVRSALGAMHLFNELPSTNAWALAHGTCASVCLAEQQSAGRGRRGRVWQSPSGVNIYLSLRWCFPSVPKQLPLLSLVTGIAVAEALAACGCAGHGIKWPNDIYHQGKKLGGILLEAVGQLDQVVIGIGLNVNVAPETAAPWSAAIDQPWTSVQAMQGKPMPRNALVAALLNRLVTHLQAFPTWDQATFAAHWQTWDLLEQQPVRVLAGQAVWEGIAAGVDSQGQLRLQLPNGSLQLFSSADVSVRM